MEPETLAALIAFFALGANLLGTVVQLMLDPRSRALRWFALFELDIMLWLTLQGWMYARGEVGALGPFYEGSVHMLPGLFLAATLVDVRGWSDLRAAAVALASAALLPITIGAFTGAGGNGIAPLVWQLAGWGAGGALHSLHPRPRPDDPGVRRRLALAVAVTLMVIGPVAVVVGWLSGGQFFIYVMPLLTVAIQVLIVFGILHLRFYDIEVRAARSGETAARGAELERLAILGEVSASFAHEVRNPLTGVRSLAQRLSEEDVDEERRRRYAGVIVREVGRVEQIVSNLLGVARRSEEDASDRGPTALGPLFEDLALLVSSRAGTRHVQVVTEPAGLEVSAPREPLAQACLNLLLNGIHHTPVGGRVELRARPLDGFVDIVVSDEGPGIPPEERERVFEPLFSGSGGTGLGLAVVRRLAERHGWEVSVSEAKGGGAELAIRVPR